MADEKNYFKELLDIDVSPYIEKKNGLDYISWARSWSEVKKRYPDSTYTIYENKDGLNYFTDGKTCWVKTGATVNGIEHIEYLPVMDYRNKSIPVNTVTSFDINKAIQRSLTKALARHGLGISLYYSDIAVDDAPEEEKCESCGKPIVSEHGIPVEKLIAGSVKAYGKKLCYQCAMKAKSDMKKDGEKE